MSYKTPKTPSREDERGRNSQGNSPGVIITPATRDNSFPETTQLMEVILAYFNMSQAFGRVTQNKGAPGIDGMSTTELKGHLHKHWPRIKEEILEGRYTPSPVVRVDIPKPGGKGMRQLGIPTVMDRLIQQALHQVLSPIFDRNFSADSYGFRPGKSAHQALLKAKEYIAEGRPWIVDIDLEKFFDRVNHDILMSRIARRIKDKRVLLLIRRFLQAGIMDGGIVSPRAEGTPQGGPLSPLLSNILLDDLDKELERRELPFCRYADDCNIYVRTERQGKRVMAAITKFVTKRLKLKVNEEKSAVARHYRRKFLGYSTTSNKSPKLRVAPGSTQRLKEKLRKEFRQGRGRSIKQTIEKMTPLLRGWMNYFKLADAESIFKELDGWIRHKLRGIIWRQLKRRNTRYKALTARGTSSYRAWKLVLSQKGPWRSSESYEMNMAYPNRYFEEKGYVSLQSQKRRINLL